MQRHTVYLYLETALHVSGGTSTHHQERIQLYLQYLVFVTQLLLSAAIVEEVELVWVYCGWRSPPTAHSNRFQLNRTKCQVSLKNLLSGLIVWMQHDSIPLGWHVAAFLNRYNKKIWTGRGGFESLTTHYVKFMAPRFPRMGVYEGVAV
jgi:hypothetical protein